MMPTLIVTTRAGEERQLDGEAGLSVMEVIRDGGIVHPLPKGPS